MRVERIASQLLMMPDDFFREAQTFYNETKPREWKMAVGVHFATDFTVVRKQRIKELEALVSWAVTAFWLVVMENALNVH